MKPPIRAGIYARRSPRPTESETVARQLADSRALCDGLGWEVVNEYVDNDISAYSLKRRPDYKRLLADLESGRINAVAAAHTTRIYRHVKDFVPFLDLVQKVGAEVRTVTSGHFDLNTASGRKAARQAGLDAMYEAELLGERVTRERRARAAEGRPTAGGLRPFGYEADKVTLHPLEAPLVADAAERVAAGESLWRIAEEWNQAGVTTTSGNPWEVTAVRRVLTAPRYAGLRSYKGEVVGPATWPAIISTDTRDLIVGFTGSRRRGRPRMSTWLLSGLIACPRCGRVLYGSTRGRYRAYACAPGPSTGRGCGGASVSAAACEAKVEAFIEKLIEENRLEISGALDVPDDGSAIDDRLLALAERFGALEISPQEYDAARAALTRQIEQGKLAAQPVAPGDLEALWRSGLIPERRTVIEGAVRCPMQLSPERLKNPADRLLIEEA